METETPPPDAPSAGIRLVTSGVGQVAQPDPRPETPPPAEKE